MCYTCMSQTSSLALIPISRADAVCLPGFSPKACLPAGGCLIFCWQRRPRNPNAQALPTGECDRTLRHNSPHPSEPKVADGRETEPRYSGSVWEKKALPASDYHTLPYPLAVLQTAKAAKAVFSEHYYLRVTLTQLTQWASWLTAAEAARHTFLLPVSPMGVSLLPVPRQSI